MDETTNLTNDIHLEDILVDQDAIYTCRCILKCYESDTGTKGIDKINGPSSSYIVSSVKNGMDGIKSSIDSIDHAISVLDSLLHKTVINDTSDIIQSFDEVNKYSKLIDDTNQSICEISEDVKNKFSDLVSLYNSIDLDKKALERLYKVHEYSSECKRVIKILQMLHERVVCLGNSPNDFVKLLLISCQYNIIAEKIFSLEKTDILHVILDYSMTFKSAIIKKCTNHGIMSVFSSSESLSKVNEKILVIVHHIFKEFSTSSKYILELIESLIRGTSDCIKLKEILPCNESNPDWQQLLISQVSEFLEKYITNQRGLYLICKTSKLPLHEKLEKGEKELLKAFMGKMAHAGSQDPFSYCELYSKRCIGLLQITLSHLNEENGQYDIPMLIPELISLGESAHSELSHMDIPFNMYKYYFKIICEDYAKTFLSVAAKRIIPMSKLMFSNCIGLLPHLERGNRSSGINDHDMNLCAILLVNLPVKNEISNVIYEFLERSKMCEPIFKQIQSIVASALENILADVSQIRSNSGTRLSLNDGGSKIVLCKPNEAQCLNAKLHQLVYVMIHRIESNFGSFIDKKSPFWKVIESGRETPLINHWADDVGETIWHTFSYISTAGNIEFSWKTQQLLISTQHVIKICNFLRETYFDPLVPVGQFELLKKFATHTISSFITYAISIWPLDENEQIMLLNSTTELEFALSEILRELPKFEADCISTFRRLIFLTNDELFSMSELQNSSENTLLLPKDIIALHVAVRLLRRPGLHDLQSWALNSPLHKFLDTNNIHSMMRLFKNSFFQQEPGQLTPHIYDYLSSFEHIEHDMELYNKALAYIK
ncbi:hypothetical protein BEWA_033860 [Theileria equi strain WA]|uniref:Uncharacterized protein n=1 Tax=Theileria equi strain WA TaxID=1537102 RepID=L0AZV3_THEEQ|nr:hypothetical protein BEWA_033860 [Theileria equi strain WA]AFZ80531.1 hypothetical protein BEWA_033860 [Theileria equi strain WA]|eukprot:XP_004830197.1 hypothetical protein BEWA_033860 [Theileria equi strain WA]